MAKADVPLRLGTVTQQPFVVPDAALHAEIAAFEEASMARERSWKLAIRAAAAVLGVSDRSRLPVDRADLLVSSNSPYRPSWEARTSTVSICGGACLLAADLDDAIQRELARFESRVGNYMSRWLARLALDRTARRFVG